MPRGFDNKTILFGAAFFLTAVLFIPRPVLGRVGVGVGTGKMILDKPVKPGITATLPLLAVINTGTEPSEYEVVVTYHQDQPQLMPPESWFVFSPRTFRLDPGKVETVGVKLSLPVKVTPGEYFGYLEAHPVAKPNAAGNTTIGVAAASKLYFTVAPANIWQGMYYKVSFWFNSSRPWNYIILTLIALALLIVILRRFITFNIGIDFKK